MTRCIHSVYPISWVIRKIRMERNTYWLTGNAFCVFFGSTPASKEKECRAASNVNVFGKVIGDLSPLWDVEDGVG